MSASAEGLLAGLGLSGLEGEIYLSVLQNPGNTGYRISQLLGKAAPNTYKALNSLVVKGAVLPDDGDSSRTYTAVSVGELASQAKKRISAAALELESELAGTHHREELDGLYSFSMIPQVFARAESMIDQALKTIVMDADTLPVSELSSALESAAARGVKVLVHGRDHMELKGCEYIASVTEGWRGEMLVLVADSREYLLCFMSSGMKHLHKAVWSSNFIAACMHRSYLCKALFYRIAMLTAEEGISVESLRKETARLWETWGYTGDDRGSLSAVLKK